MSALKRLLIFIGICIVSWVVFYGVVFTIFPDELSNHRQFDVAIRTNFAFVISTQLALLFGTMAAIKLQPHLTSRKNPERTISMPNAKGFVLGSIYGVVIISITVVTLVLLGNVSILPAGFSFQLIQFAFLFLIAAYSEELLCRGYIFRMLNQEMNKYPALLISSAFFVLLHGLNASLTLIGIANLFLSGVLLTLVYSASKNDLSVPTGLHFMWNFLQGPILGFRVSGLKIEGIFEVAESPSIWSGGGFGLEGSLLLSVFLLVAVLLLAIPQINHRPFSSVTAPERPN